MYYVTFSFDVYNELRKECFKVLTAFYILSSMDHYIIYYTGRCVWGRMLLFTVVNVCVLDLSAKLVVRGHQSAEVLKKMKTNVLYWDLSIMLQRLPTTKLKANLRNRFDNASIPKIQAMVNLNKGSFWILIYFRDIGLLTCTFFNLSMSFLSMSLVKVHEVQDVDLFSMSAC